MYVRNDIRFNPYATVILDGVTYASGQILKFPEVMAIHNIKQIPDPLPPADYSDFTHYRTDQDTAPYTIYTLKPEPQLQEARLQQAKLKRQQEVLALTVTTSSGKVFDGDEESQSRMSRTLQVAQLTGIQSCVWVLADNTPTSVTATELSEALALSVQAMGELWAKPYEV